MSVLQKDGPVPGNVRALLEAVKLKLPSTTPNVCVENSWRLRYAFDDVLRLDSAKITAATSNQTAANAAVSNQTDKKTSHSQESSSMSTPEISNSSMTSAPVVYTL